MSKTVSIIGGSGYVGRRVINEILRRGGNNVKVYSISRRGDDVSNKIIDNRLMYIKGDGLNPSTFENVIKESHSIVHSVGVLITDKQPNENGSYNMVNKESCLRVANLANLISTQGSKKNIVYVSASRGFPYPLSIRFPGYYQSKLECEEGLRKLSNLNSIIIKPAFIKDLKDRWWSIPLALGTDTLNLVDKSVIKRFIPKISDILTLPDQSIELEVVARYCAAGALGELEARTYMNEEMILKPLI